MISFQSLLLLLPGSSLIANTFAYEYKPRQKHSAISSSFTIRKHFSLSQPLFNSHSFFAHHTWLSLANAMQCNRTRSSSFATYRSDRPQRSKCEQYNEIDKVFRFAQNFRIFKLNKLQMAGSSWIFHNNRLLAKLWFSIQKIIILHFSRRGRARNLGNEHAVRRPFLAFWYSSNSSAEENRKGIRGWWQWRTRWNIFYFE